MPKLTSHRFRLHSLFLGVSLAALGAAQAAAQSNAAASADTTATVPSIAQVETVVVTAQKTQENLQDVPLAVTALSGADIAKFHKTDLRQLTGSIPNVQIQQITNVGISATMFIRGIGVSEGDPYAGTAVSIVQDGVVEGTNNTALANLFDVERIEVLRGPQGTLFGANTTGGVVNIVTRQPTGEFGVYGTATLGNYNEIDINGAVNFPITDQLAGKVSFSHQGRDGFYTAVDDKNNLGNINRDIGRAYFKFDGGDDFTSTLILEYDRNRDGSQPVINLANPSEFLYDPAGEQTSINFKTFSHPPFNQNDLDQYSATWTSDLKTSIGNLTAITNYTRYFFRNATDYTGTSFLALTGDRGIHHWQFSQELRDELNPIESLRILVGGFVLTQNYNLYQDSLYNAISPGLSAYSTQDQDNWSASLFAQGYWDVTDRLQVQLGARVTYEKTTMRDTVQNSISPDGISTLHQVLGDCCAISNLDVAGEDSWRNWGAKAGLTYKFTDDMMGYINYARGFKSGGFNGRIQSAAELGPYNPEFVETFEGGLKTELFDRRVRLNGDGFYNKYHDMQVPQIGFTNGQATSTIANAASATTYGFELESDIVAADDLTLNGSIGYLQAHYDSFISGTTVYSGKTLPNAPHVTLSVGGNYTFPVLNGQTDLNLQYNYTSEFFSDFTQVPIELMKPRSLVNGNLSWGPDGATWSVALWAKNMLNNHYVESSLDIPPLWTEATYGPPRQFGIDVNFHT